MGTISLFLFFTLKGVWDKKKNVFLVKIKEKKGSSLYSFMLRNVAPASSLLILHLPLHVFCLN